MKVIHFTLVFANLHVEPPDSDKIVTNGVTIKSFVAAAAAAVSMLSLLSKIVYQYQQ